MDEDVSNPKRRNPFKAIAKVLKTFAIGYIFVCIMLSVLERFLVYPAPPLSRSQWQRDDLELEEVQFQSDDGTSLHGWHFPHESPRAQILFFHGNAQQVADLGDFADELRTELQASVFVFDYRGYGRSDGKAFEAGVLSDGQAAQKWLANREGIQPDEVILYGLSLGGGVAVNCASTLGARCLVLDRTFHSMTYTAAWHYPWVPVSLLMRNRYPSSQRIATYSGPLIQLHGPPDEVVPFESGKLLFEACPSENKQFLKIDVLTHLEPVPAQLQALLNRWLTQGDI